MARPFSEQDKQKIITMRRSGKTIAEISAATGFSEIFIKRKCISLLSKEERQAIRKNSYKNPEYIEKQRESQKKAASRLSTSERRARDQRLKRQSIDFAAKVRNGEYTWDDAEIQRRSDHGKKIGFSEKHQKAMRFYAQQRKKYHPEVIRKHFDSFGLRYEADLSSSENYVRFFWDDGSSRKMQIKRVMLLREIEPPSLSRPEKEVLSWIQSLGLPAQKRRIGGKEIDIYIEPLKLGIEVNGMFWHSEACKSRTYHAKKTEFFKKRGIRLVHIFESEWNTRRDQVENYLLSCLRKNRSIGARKLDWREVSIRDASAFMDRFHIQGSNSISVRAWGGFLDGELITCATFGRHHRTNTGFVLNRFACKKGITVSGALSKISKIAFREFRAPILSWADKRLSEGAGYLRAGWKLEAETRPDYFYWSRKTGVVSKQSRMKSKVGTPPGMTEYEHAQADGLLRIWDCGKIRVVFGTK